MTTYFHCSALPLGNGSIILPGNWGRIIRLYHSNPSNHFIAFREYVLEKIRAIEFLSKPSRLDSCFVLKTFDEAQAYQIRNSPVGVLYEVEPVGEVQSLHEASYDLNPEPQSYFNHIEQAARDYWMATKLQSLEVVIPLPIRIIRRCT